MDILKVNKNWSVLLICYPPKSKIFSIFRIKSDSFNLFHYDLFGFEVTCVIKIFHLVDTKFETLQPFSYPPDEFLKEKT